MSVFDNVKVDRTVWDRLRAKAAMLEKAYVKVGVLASKGGSAKHEDGKLSLIEIAAIHEFGLGSSPERSFIRHTFIVRVAEDLAKKTAELARAVIMDRVAPMRALEMLGMWGASEVKKTITEDDIPPPLAQSTIDAKGSSKPLVDTGLLKNSISYEVVEQ